MLQKMKQIEEKKKILRNLLLVAAIIFFFVFIVAFSVYYISDAINSGSTGSPVPIPLIAVLLSSLGFFVGTLIYYILTTRFSETEAKINENVFETLAFLPPDERKIIKAVIKQPTTQANLARTTRMTRVKTHRVVQRLIERDVLKKDKNIIELNEKLRKIF